MRSNRNQEFPPIEEGKTYDVKIERLGWGGDGIATINGHVIFVPGTKVGERVKVKITNIKKKFSFSEVVRSIS